MVIIKSMEMQSHNLDLDKKSITKSRQMYFVETLYIGESIDLKRVQEKFKRYKLLNREHPLVFQVSEIEYFVLTKFGGVTFWNVDKGLQTQILTDLKVFSRSKLDSYPYDEDIEVLIGFSKERVTFEKVYLDHLKIEELKLISYVLSQSVALERYEQEIEFNVSELGSIVENLKSHGRVFLRQRELLRHIGRVLSVKQTAVAHLSLFDKPEEVWELPELERLYNKLNSEYEIKTRFEVLDEKINYLSDISKMLMDFLAERRNAFLELVIIILIAIEVIPILFNYFKKLILSFT